MIANKIKLTYVCKEYERNYQTLIMKRVMHYITDWSYL